MYSDGGDGVEAWAWPRSGPVGRQQRGSRRCLPLGGVLRSVGGRGLREDLLPLSLLEKVLSCFSRVSGYGTGSPVFLPRP